MKKLLILLAFLLCFATRSQAQPAQRTIAPSPVVHNGDWWRNKSPLYHEAYVGGYKEGVRQTLGHETDFSSFAAKDIVTGITKFYDDFRNRNIQFPQVIVYVADQLRGVADDKLAAELLKLRATAAAPARDE